MLTNFHKHLVHFVITRLSTRLKVTTLHLSVSSMSCVVYSHCTCQPYHYHYRYGHRHHAAFLLVLAPHPIRDILQQVWPLFNSSFSHLSGLILVKNITKYNTISFYSSFTQPLSLILTRNFIQCK